MVRMVRMVRMFYEVRLSRICFLISRRRSKPQCGSINLCNPFARSAGILLSRFGMFGRFNEVWHVWQVWKRTRECSSIYEVGLGSFRKV